MKSITSVLICFIILWWTVGGIVLATDREEDIAPGPNEVRVGKTAIEMPLGRILLVRKDQEYCAVRFTEFWTGKTEQDYFARYESYYPADKTGMFPDKSTKLIREELSYPKPRGIGRFSFSFGNKEIGCGFTKLFWTRRGIVCFFSKGQKPGDYGIELAPTPWTNISRVNVFDPRIKWYRYDETRERVNIPIDKLWQETEEEKEK